MGKKSDNKIKRCEHCGSGFTYIRIKNNELVCRNCGYIKKIEEEKDEDKKE